MLKNYDDSRHKPLSWKEHLENERADENRRHEEQQRPIREAEAALTESHRKIYALEKAEIEAGRTDSAWTMPTSADGLHMTIDQAKVYAQREAEAFVAEHDDYFPTAANFGAITSYLSAQKIVIPTRDCFAQAAERLRHFGLLEERPAPAPEPAPVEPPTESIELTEAPREELVGIDTATGRERIFTQREVDLMGSEEFRRVFRLCATRDQDRRPRFDRSRY